jgi:hypothetical protein
MKKPLNTLLAISIFIAPILCANSSQSSGKGYPPHANPFRIIRTKYSQSAGDAQCRKDFEITTRVQKVLVPSSKFGEPNTYVDYYPDLYSFHGVRINRASHV